MGDLDDKVSEAIDENGHDEFSDAEMETEDGAEHHRVNKKVSPQGLN